jgi:alkylation response protein AidB-like acyl-CoA dehydrogenase
VSAPPDLRTTPTSLATALEEVAAGALHRDAHPSYPREPFGTLAEAGALALNLPGRDGEAASSFAEELATVRAVARADGSVGRIYDGHLNGVERLGLLADEPLRSEELARVEAGELILGVWGADPLPAEGEPARLDSSGERLHGVKVFCSGAGGVDRALVNVRRADGSGPPLLAYLDLSEDVEVDREWFRGAGMRASESHRVVFEGTPVLAVLGEPGELSRQPWFSRDGIRTAATWAGVLDSAIADALATLRAKPARGQLEELAVGRMLAEQAALDLWLAEAGRRAESAVDLAFSVSLREAIAAGARRALDEAARACGSRPFAVGSALDRARRDLEIFLLQHRLDPLVARVGGGALGGA